MRGIIRLNGTTYEDYDITLMCEQSQYNHKDKILVNEWGSIVVDKINSLVHSMPEEKIPKGSSVYLTPNSPCAVADVRKNYTIKRDFDTADYNVLKEFGASCSSNINIYGYAISDIDKKILIFNGENGNFPKEAWTKEVAISYGVFSKQAVRDLFFAPLYYDTTNWGRDYYKSYGRLSAIKIAPVYLALYDRKLTKPCVQYSALDLNSELELSQDVLQLVYNAGKQQRTQNTLDNFIIQLNTLNNYNWRDYAFTVSMLLHSILPGFCGVRNYVDNHISTFPKQIKNLFENRTAVLTNEKDFQMAKAFLKNILGLDGTKFTSLENLSLHLDQAHVPFDCFNTVFNSMVKITERNYEDYAPF